MASVPVPVLVMFGLLSIFYRGLAYKTYRDSGQCDQLAQVQSAVVQILTSHYEYSKGIHKLHSLVTSLQNDISSIKNKVTDSEIQVGVYDGNMTDFLKKFETSLGTLSSALVVHKGRFKHMRKRLNGLKRTVRKTSKFVLNAEKEKSYEELMLKDFIKRQTDINVNSQARIKRLEVMLQKAIIQVKEPKTGKQPI